MRLYVELKKSFPEFVRYPLCVTISDQSKEELEFGSETEAAICVEGMKTDAHALAVDAHALLVIEL